MTTQWDLCLIHAEIMTLNHEKGLGMIHDGAIAIHDNQIVWMGPFSTLPDIPSKKTIDMKGKLITPGLIDCHTHVVYAGNRSHEFEMRLKGESYENIAKAGGGIRSTVKATIEASEEQLFIESLARVKEMISHGVRTLEIKSGYGLDLETEIKILRVAKRIGEHLNIHVISTFLGAHALPAEYKDRSDDYINLVCETMIPIIAQENLAVAVDAFCENIGFSVLQVERVFSAAKKYGLAIKCHAEQLSNIGATKIATTFNALSCDHLEHINENDILLMSAAKTVAVLLPGAFYFLREAKKPPVDLFRKYEVPIAIATDCNPGTSPTTHLPLMMNMACVLFGLTVEEAWLGVTKHAARALGLPSTYTELRIGGPANFITWEANSPAECIAKF